MGFVRDLYKSSDSDEDIARFSIPYVKSLQINVISQQKIQNGTYQ